MEVNSNGDTDSSGDMEQETPVEEVSDGEGNGQPSGDWGSNGGSLGGVASRPLQGNSEGTESGGVFQTPGERSGGSNGQTDAAGSGGRSGLGDNSGGSLCDAGDVSNEEQLEQEVKTNEEVANQEQPRGNNFVIPEEGLNLPSGDKARVRANIEAIKTLRKIMAEGRFALPEEKTILSAWPGRLLTVRPKKTKPLS